MTTEDIIYKHYDAIVIGAGGAGLMSSLNLAQSNLNIACLSKVFPTKSHTIAAQGGINAPLGNMAADNPDWFIYDTVRGGDYLSDHDSVSQLCNNAQKAILDLEKIGVNFSKNKDGSIYQRKYGGQTINFGDKPAYRACNVADRTGLEILTKLYQRCKNSKVEFFSQIFALNLVIEDKQIIGVLGWDFSLGELICFKTNFVIIATGGFSQIYKTNTSAAICTGDGNALALKAQIPLQDMEFIQFHPTGLYNYGLLITEAARAEGGYLTSNKENNPHKFMQDYAPKYHDLASRDIISRAIFNEIEEGRGYGQNKDHVFLHLENLPTQKIIKQLPTVTETAKNFANIDVTRQPIPVTPSVHYTMGGIVTNQYAQVNYYQENQLISYQGLYAVGETASSSVHGANRLGCNSLLELIVFGKIAAQDIIQKFTAGKIIQQTNFTNKTNNNLNLYIKEFKKNIGNNDKNISNKIADYKNQLQNIMTKNVGVIRNGTKITQAIKQLTILQQETNKLKVSYQNLKNNFELISLLELKNMILQAIAVSKTSLWRKESRGSHFRADYQDRNDNNFTQHSLYQIDGNGRDVIFTQPVRSFLEKKDSRFLPQKRKY